MTFYKSTLLLFFALIWSCDIKNNDVEPSSAFVKIYDDNRFEQEYYPLDIVQTADDGFLILSEKKADQSLFTSVHVLKTDAQGNVVSQTEMESPYVYPVDGWSKIGDMYYFVCMDENSLQGALVAVDEAGTLAAPLPILGITFPLVATQDGSNLVVLSFDNVDGESVLSVIDAAGQVTQQASYNIGAGVDVDKPVIDHITRNGPQLPFSVGKISNNKYYFNGFYNYTFSLVFSDLTANPTGVCQGQLSLGGISAVTSLGNDIFGVARFNFGDNYLNPIANIPTNSVSSSTDIGGNTFPEIESEARVKILDLESKAKWVYGTNTISNQIILNGFDQSSGTILGTEYLGSGNPYTFSSFIMTNDGGIAILAQTAIEGRFKRIALFKRDADFLNGLVQ